MNHNLPYVGMTACVGISQDSLRSSSFQNPLGRDYTGLHGYTMRNEKRFRDRDFMVALCGGQTPLPLALGACNRVDSAASF
jgi:hypothetical protein